MPSEIIEIRIVTRGATQSATEIERVGQSAQRAHGSVNFLARALKSFIAFNVVREVVEMSDAFANLSNRVAVFAKDSGEATRAVRGLTDIAIRSRQSLEAAGTVFQRFSIAGREAGLAQEEILAFTETLLKATTISGATAQEAEGALRQLLQGFSANRLSGQELNSVLEQTPVIAALIAKQVGVGVGQLRVLANRSKEVSIITRDVLIKALREGAAEIEAAFARTNVTYAQALTNVKTAVSVLFGEINRAGSAIGVLPRAISFVAVALVRLAQNQNVMRGAAAALNVALTALALRGLTLAAKWAYTLGRTLIVDAYRGAIAAAKGFWALTVSAGPAARAVAVLNVALKASKLAILGVVGIFTFFGDVTLPGLNTTLFDIAAVLGGRLLEAISKAAKAVSDFFGFDPATSNLGAYLSKFVSFFADEGVLAEAQQRTASRQKEQPGFSTGTNSNIETETAAMRRLKDLFEDFQNAQRLVTAGLNPFDKALAEVLKDTTDLEQRFDDLIGKLGVTKEQVDALTKAYNDNRKAEYVREVQDAAAAFDPLLAAHVEYERALERIRQIQQTGLAGPGGFFQFDAANAALEASKQFELAQLEALARVQTGYEAFFTGIKLGFRQWVDSLTTDAQIISSGLQSIFQSATGALTTFLETGKFNIREFALSVIKTAQQVIVQLLILAAVRALAGLGGAGAAGGAADSAAQAGGGNNFAVASFATGTSQVARGTPSIVGERGPELFTPPATGSITPNSEMGGGGAQNVTIVNVMDQAEVARMVGSAEGEKAVLNVINKNRGRVKQSIGA